VRQRGHLSNEAPEAYPQYVEDADLRRGPRWRADLRPQQTLGEMCGLEGQGQDCLMRREEMLRGKVRLTRVLIIIAYGNTWDWKSWDTVGTMRGIPSLVQFWSDQ